MSITVKTQADLDRIPLDTEEKIYIRFGTTANPAIIKNKYIYPVVASGNSSVEASGNSSVEARDNSSVVAYSNNSVKAYGNSFVEARDNSSVVAWGNSFVVAWDNSTVVAYGNSSVAAYGNSSVKARDNSSVAAWDDSSVEARNNSYVKAYGNSSVEASGNSTVAAWDDSTVAARNNSYVKAYGNSSVEAWGNSSVVAWDNSYVKAYDNSSVVAWDNSSVVAWNNSTVEAWDNSTVEAKGNVQVVDRLTSGAIWLSSNARKVCMPKTIEEYLNFYDIETDGKTAILYKAVHKQEGEYVSDYDTTFKYIIGGLITEPNCNTDVDENCGKSIHVSHLNWVLDYGRGWSDLAILELEVQIKDIIMPLNSNGKVRVPKAKVIREVPLSECGLYGKILERNII